MGRATKDYFIKLQKGLCTDCGEPNDRQGRALCSVCAAKLYSTKVYYMQRKKGNIPFGICAMCLKKPIAEGHTKCQECLDKRREYYKKRKKGNENISQ